MFPAAPVAIAATASAPFAASAAVSAAAAAAAAGVQQHNEYGAHLPLTNGKYQRAYVLVCGALFGSDVRHYQVR